MLGDHLDTVRVQMQLLMPRMPHEYLGLLMGPAADPGPLPQCLCSIWSKVLAAVRSVPKVTVSLTSVFIQVLRPEILLSSVLLQTSMIFLIHSLNQSIEFGSNANMRFFSSVSGKTPDTQ